MSEVASHGPERTPMLLRMWRASILHADTYEEVEADHSSILQAFVIVLGVCLSSGVGAWLAARQGVGGAFPVALVAVEPLINWLGGSVFAFMVGASFFRGEETESDYPEVLRTVGFAFTPSLLAGLAFPLADPIGLGLLVALRMWTWVACIVAVRQALDFTTARAVGTFGVAAVLFRFVLWRLTVVPMPI